MVKAKTETFKKNISKLTFISRGSFAGKIHIYGLICHSYS